MSAPLLKTKAGFGEYIDDRASAVVQAALAKTVSSIALNTAGTNTANIDFRSNEIALLSLASATTNVLISYVLPEVAGKSGILIVTNHGTTPRNLQWVTFPPIIQIWRAGAFANTSSDSPGSVRIYEWFFDGTRLFMSQSPAQTPS